MDIHRKIWSFSTKHKLTPSLLVDNKTKIKTSQIEKRVWIGLEVKVALIASHRSQVPPPPNSAIGRTTKNWNLSSKSFFLCLLSLGSGSQILQLKQICLALWLLLLTQCCDSEELIFLILFLIILTSKGLVLQAWIYHLRIKYALFTPVWLNNIVKGTKDPGVDCFDQ